MPAEEEERVPEVIIVRRGGDDEDEGHHGGVWKIAFADFMTAMMCFFLVMWLINASSEETRTALASYFNPVKLIDQNTNRKGLEELGRGPQSAAEPGEDDNSTGLPSGGNENLEGATSARNAEDISDRPVVYSDENFFSDPYAVLAEIAAETGTRQNVSPKGEGGEQNAGPSSGATGGEAYRDPFAPDFWAQQVAEPKVGMQGDPHDERTQPGGSAEAQKQENADQEEPATAADRPEEQSVATLTSETSTPTQEEPEQPSTTEEKAGTPAEDETAQISEEQRKQANRIRTALAEALEGDSVAAAVDVTATPEGVLISITDDLQEELFAVGSAVPQRSLVLAMEKIGGTLAERPGALRIHGHTDGRPFAGDSYDNWRLSTARAHAAHYMLTRGGVDEQRILEVAGFADRRLKVPEDPFADANRRIEILLEPPQ